MYISSSQKQAIYRNALYTTDKKTGYKWEIISFGNVKNIDNDFMLLTGSCGRGKTTFALDLSEEGLLAHINAELQRRALVPIEKIKPEEVLFLVSRLNIKKQQIKNPNTVIATEQDYSSAWASNYNEGKIRLQTAHWFGRQVRLNKVIHKPKLIIVDELHSIFAETIFADDLYFVLDYLKNNKAIKVGMSATPSFLFDYIEEIGDFIFTVLDIADLGSKYVVEDIIPMLGGTAKSIVRQFPIGKENKVLVYVTSARECYEMAQATPNSAFIVSKYNFTKIETAEGIKPLSTIMLEQVYEGLDICEYITEKECFPAEVNVLFINSASREGINIKDDKVKTIICEAVDMITIEQILGRLRQDIEKFYVICNGNRKTYNDKVYNELLEFLKAYKAEGEKALARRYGAQEQARKDGNKDLQNFVVYTNGEYKLNNYARAYIQYIKNSYDQVYNYRNDETLTQNGKRLLSQYDYLAQLTKYTDKDSINIKFVQDEVKALNKQKSLDKFTIIESKYLNRRLTKADKDELCAELDMIRSKDRKASWTTVKKELTEAGYKVTDKKSNGERYTVISK